VIDTSPQIEAMVADRHREMSAEERWRAAAALFETARAIVDSSLPAGLSRADRRLAWARRLYGTELPDKALAAFAAFPPAK
jgi:hypothetical protein